ncbi:hypothetical protein PSY81_23615, partial [Shigella flexneri]|nr:hypothetical protein [Shigella flexneri]
MQKYCKKHHPATISPSTAQTHAWNRLLSVRPIMLEHTKWFLGTGHVNFWWDKWLSMEALGSQIIPAQQDKQVQD